MSTSPDRLYELLPAVYRLRDVEQGYPLKALLRVIGEQVDVVEADIAQLYENWFIETAEDWAVPYIADLIGYKPAADAGNESDDSTREGRELNRILIPRRDVANTIRYRRRRGTLALLELLSGDIAGWPARAVEFFKLLIRNQNIDYLHLDRLGTVDLHRVERLDLIDGPFDRTAHTVDVRRIDSCDTKGRCNIPSVGLFVWRLKEYSITHSPANCAEDNGPECHTFSVLGQDTPLFANPKAETDPTHIATEANVPAPIRRLAFWRHKERFYGPDKSFAIWADGWNNVDPNQPVPINMIVPADLSGWGYVPTLGHIAVDPVLGRFSFPPSQLPKKGARVTYHYGFSADMGGGEYDRKIFDPSPRQIQGPDPTDQTKTVWTTVSPVFYKVGPDQPVLRKIGDALNRWKQDNPLDAVIEVTDSGVYTEPVSITLNTGQTLQLRAANGVRPVIRLIDWQTDLPDALSVTMAASSRFTMDGFLVTGRPLHVTEQEDATGSRPSICGSEVVIRHCTLVPGWGIDCNCNPKRPAEPSLELFNIRASLRIEHSIVGSIQIHESEIAVDPIPVRITDSILDATDGQREAIGAPGFAVAHALLTIKRTTVFGIVDVRAIELAENCIFNNCVNVARRQLGCMRFCYVPIGCRTPRRYACQLDLVVKAVMDEVTDPTERAALIAGEQLRVQPQFTSVRYGKPGYAQLGTTCAKEIKRGADDESEMGAFHDLFQPQREANLRSRLEDFTPAGTDVGIIFVT